MRILLKGELMWLPEISGYVTSREVYIKHSGEITHLKKGAKKSGGTTQTIQKADPWVGQQPYLRDIFAQAQKQFYSNAQTPYQGQVVATQTPDTLQAQDILRGAATGDLATANQQGKDAASFGLSTVLNPDSNQYLQESVQQSQQPTIDNFTQQVLPQIRSGAGDAGQYGGTRQGIVEGLATQGLARALQEDSSRRYSDSYNRGLETFQKTLALLPQTSQLALQPATALDAVGQQNQSQAQAELSAAIGQYNDLQNNDANKLAAYQSLVQGNYGGQSNSTATGVGAPQAGIGSKLLGGAATGAGLSTALGFSGPIGAGIGAVLSLF